MADDDLTRRDAAGGLERPADGDRDYQSLLPRKGAVGRALAPPPGSA